MKKGQLKYKLNYIDVYILQIESLKEKKEVKYIKEKINNMDDLEAILGCIRK